MQITLMLQILVRGNFFNVTAARDFYNNSATISADSFNVTAGRTFSIMLMQQSMRMILLLQQQVTLRMMLRLMQIL